MCFDGRITWLESARSIFIQVVEDGARIFDLDHHEVTRQAKLQIIRIENPSPVLYQMRGSVACASILRSFKWWRKGLEFLIRIIMWWASQALDDPNRKFQPRPLLNGKICCMCLNFVKFQVVEGGARIFDLDHHVVGKPSSR